MTKEQTFILITNLARVRIIDTVLRQVYHGKTGCIDENEYKKMASTLQKWQDTLTEKVDKAGF